VHTTDEELTNVDKWAKLNNLKLNKDKSKEIIFVSPRFKDKDKANYPALIDGVERVTELKCLGITLSSNFSFTTHINNTISSCSSNLFALYCLRSKGLSNELLQIIFQAATLSRLLYASPFWWGYVTASDRDRLEAFLRKAKRAGFYSKTSSFEELCASADQMFFKAILQNPNNLLSTLLPPLNNHIYSTRRNVSGRTYQIPTKRTSLYDKNFIIRMSLDDARRQC
jgi:hypothetical protein